MEEGADRGQGVTKINFNFLYQEVECAITEELKSLSILKDTQECYENLIRAIRDGNECAVEELLILCGDKFGELFLMQIANKRDEVTGYSPLFLAIKVENSEIIKLLLDIGKAALTNNALQFAESITFSDAEAKLKICDSLTKKLKKPLRTPKFISRLKQLNEWKDLYNEPSCIDNKTSGVHDIVSGSTTVMSKLNASGIKVN